MKERTRIDEQGNVYTQQWTDSEYPAVFANEDDLREKLRQALVVNLVFTQAAKPATAAAQASQAYDQTVRLTRQNSALIRVILNLLTDISGT